MGQSVTLAALAAAWTAGLWAPASSSGRVSAGPVWGRRGGAGEARRPEARIRRGREAGCARRCCLLVLFSVRPAGRGPRGAGRVGLLTGAPGRAGYAGPGRLPLGLARPAAPSCH